MLYAVFASVAAAVMVVMVLSSSLAANKISNVKANSTRAEYLAEGAVEEAKRQVLTNVAGWKVPPAAGTINIDGHAVNYTIVPTGFSTTRLDPSGIQTIVTTYMIDATSQLDSYSAHSYRLVNSESTPAFQYAVFYNTDLEINPGPNMTLAGRVHSNANMYLNCGGTLTVNTNYLRAAGNIYRNRKDNPAASDGTVKIRNWVANPFNLAEPTTYVQMNSIAQMGSVPNISGYDSRFTTGWDNNGDGDFTDANDYLPWGPGALAYWSQKAGYAGGTGNTVKDNAHGVTSAVPPPLGSIAAYEPAVGGNYTWSTVAKDYISTPGTGTHNMGYYHSQADLSIVAYPNLLNTALSTWKAFNKAGVDVTAAVTASGAVSLSSIYDARQAGGTPGVTTKVPIVKIDVAKLNTCSKYPTNGLLYVSSFGMGTGVTTKGVELFNGSTLKGKLTVATEGSMYIKGDYNTVAKKGASVIGDAVNLLSNAWDDTKTKAAPFNKLPTPTTYNVAMVTGNTNTVGSSYCGGLENLPRFHENWANVNCTISGSFVNFWNSKFANTQWGLAGVYSAPNRIWSYDNLFNTVANLPPFTPMTCVATDVVCW